LKASAVIASIAVVGVAATSIAGIVPARQLFAMRGSDAQVPQVVNPPAVAAAGSLADDGIAAASDSVPDIAAALAAAPAPTVPAPATTPIVGDGRTELGDGLYAIRAGQSVTVHFDVPHARTRRRDKFDRIVRATLPRIYGPVAQAALEDVPTGQLVS